jgi:hypothetical protein
LSFLMTDAFHIRWKVKRTEESYREVRVKIAFLVFVAIIIWGLVHFYL